MSSADQVYALLIIDNAPPHPSLKELVTEDWQICWMFLPPNTTSLIQPMDQGITVASKSQYCCCSLDDVIVVMEDDSNAMSDTHCAWTLANLWSYNLLKTCHNWAKVWKEIKITTLANAWKPLLRVNDETDKTPVTNSEGFETADFQSVPIKEVKRQLLVGSRRGRPSVWTFWQIAASVSKDDKGDDTEDEEDETRA